MTPEKQRIAIAEACGWKDIQDRESPSGKIFPIGFMPGVESRHHHHERLLPDYLNDLNAMHEVGKRLSIDQGRLYVVKLSVIVGDDYHEHKSHWSGEIAFATASQRAEAFLRTVGKWEEGA